jgi:hypothetical protein
MDTNTKGRGDVAEAAVIAALVRSGKRVLLPFGENSRYDLVVDEGGRFIRIQVKSGRLREGIVRCNARSYYRGGTKRTYHDDVDYIGVYCHDNDSVYLVPMADVPNDTGFLRVIDPKRDTRGVVKYASAYLFDPQEPRVL